MSAQALLFVESSTSGTGGLFGRQVRELGFRPVLMTARLRLAGPDSAAVRAARDKPWQRRAPGEAGVSVPARRAVESGFAAVAARGAVRIVLESIEDEETLAMAGGAGGRG